MPELLIATHNKGKFIEISEVFDGLPLTFYSLIDLNISDKVDENGTTFFANAEIKARFFAAKSGLPAVADDSGIIVEALQDELGIATRRWGAGENATDEKWLDHFLERMKLEENRKASFVCAVCLSWGEEVVCFEGITEGTIVFEKQAEYLPGLPLSSVFVPEGMDQVYSALSIEEKNRVGHRGKAFMQMREYLGELLGSADSFEGNKELRITNDE